MSVVVIGVNHRTAPLELLERTAIVDARLDKAITGPRGSVSPFPSGHLASSKAMLGVD